jgi:glycosyltransferase involved in cell wall biosynthesis
MNKQKYTAKKKSKVVIINRGFWPNSDVPGSSLLTLAEHLSSEHDTFVLTQSDIDIEKYCHVRNKAIKVRIKSCKLFTNSNSRVLSRAFESIYFSGWLLMSLILIRPNYIYVTTDPPLLASLIVTLYKKISNAEFTYHLQDIHPEASKIVLKLPLWLFKLLVRIDNFSLKNAKSIVTLTPNMRDYICHKRGILTPIHIIENASSFPIKNRKRQYQSIIFAGNFGRLQDIPLIISAVDLYMQNKGTMRFTFIGSGVYKRIIEELSDKWENVDYLGYLPIEEAIEVISEHEWGLLPVKTEVLKFAFPSKTSAYIAAGCNILAVCEKNSSLADWVEKNLIGEVSSPSINNIVDTFFMIERKRPIYNRRKTNSLIYSFDHFANKLQNIILK